jgi:hypothetical protein
MKRVLFSLVLLFAATSIGLAAGKEEVPGFGGTVGSILKSQIVNNVDSHGVREGQFSTAVPEGLFSSIDTFDLIGEYVLYDVTVLYDTGEILTLDDLEASGRLTITSDIFRQEITIGNEILVASGTWELSEDVMIIKNDNTTCTPVTNSNVSWDGIFLTTTTDVDCEQPAFTEIDVWKRVDSGQVASFNESTLTVHVPYFDFEDNLYWLNLQYVPNIAAIRLELTGFGPVSYIGPEESPPVSRNQRATLDSDSTTMTLHIPYFEFQDSLFWLKLKLLDDEETITLELTEFGLI